MIIVILICYILNSILEIIFHNVPKCLKNCDIKVKFMYAFNVKEFTLDSQRYKINKNGKTKKEILIKI
jgi:hypothetical protein